MAVLGNDGQADIVVTSNDDSGLICPKQQVKTRGVGELVLLGAEEDLGGEVTSKRDVEGVGAEVRQLHHPRRLPG
ncbi:hypothetical protein [Nannocystis radixulma]|uniref:Uncharacterized protein n=1 Tax=Nannocystis radixulma TaxID=2995305 RepID=A0ABT5B3Y5_9BACT|nr:hypothetical protein [Nannocystis radixulma]MDC0667776.1 hypothetical protein [Nannocystis radixulma]